MSRFIRTLSSSLRDPAISAAWSAGLGPTRRAGSPGTRARDAAAAPLAPAGRLSAHRS
jgi:hypothetical protein